LRVSHDCQMRPDNSAGNTEQTRHWDRCGSFRQ
jgi:hypothetical protein